MNTKKKNPTAKPSRRHEGARYETCRECGLDWNVSKCAVLNKNGYLCPHCWNKNR